MNGRADKLNILWLWPDILNLHGDRGNAMALVRVCDMYGIETTVKRVNRLNEPVDFRGADVVLLGAGELASLPRIAEALSNTRADMEAYIKEGGVLLVTGATGAAFGVKTFRTDGSVFSGLGVFDMICSEREAVLGDDLIIRLPDALVCGIQIQMIDITLADGQAPFGEVYYGYGNDGKGGEGARTNGAIFTNALGPVLVKNPRLTLEIIRRAWLRGNSEGASLDFDPSRFELELASAKAILAFNETKARPK